MCSLHPLIIVLMVLEISSNALVKKVTTDGIRAFQTKLNQILYVVHLGFGLDVPVYNITITLHYIILNKCNRFVVL